MKQNQYEIIVLDLDGTLTNRDKVITPRTKKALMEAQARGKKVVLASGRPTQGVMPLAEELDLKAAAAAVGVKSVEMIHVAEITALTGYVRGGCSPIGMKKRFPTVIDVSAQAFDTIIFSGGRIGTQVETAPSALAGLIGASFAAIVRGRC